MKKSDKNLVFVLMFVFGLLGLTGVFAVALFRGDEGDGVAGPLEIDTLIVWGVLPEEYVVPVLSNAEIPNVIIDDIEYTQMSIETFRNRFVEDLASGIGPDLILIPHEDILEQYEANRLLQIPYTFFPRSQYESLFINAANIFATSDGLRGIPFVVNPIVLYYNKVIADREGIRALPERWADLDREEFKQIIKKNDQGNISRALIPFGAVSNYTHIKEIVSLLQYQTARSDPRVEAGIYDNNFSAVLDNRNAESALALYSSFSNPLSEVYSWSELQNNAQLVFARGDLLFYPGFLSERESIEKQNNNLRF